ncbi:GGDEF domain-containing protein [Neiella sp. HB171785]|uniref:GGDEF domain-containing protein n=1 Tax=Neiella litorisoli TaxID=2771431 RepID=A0A8J6QFM3_9GAMM|nr:GGDEF domain-containing protein [Neiella litorisoli]MBD1388869.1 GGDEF domain-containing protein [Neiella litorisoli]
MLIYQLTQYYRFVWRHHSQRLLAALVGAIVLSGSAIQSSEPKPMIHWLDVAGEGAAALLALCWLLLLLCARPAGRVTNLLYAGALLYWFACLLDVLDEFVRYPLEYRLFADIESLAIPIAMLVVTIGLWHWLKEQKQINRQLRQRELVHREYQLLDPLTLLYGESYLQRQLQGHRLRKSPNDIELVMFELNPPVGASPAYAAVDERQLKQFAELMLSQLQDNDVLCRCGANRFALVMTNVAPAQASEQFVQLVQQVSRHMTINITHIQRSWTGQQPADSFLANAEHALQSQNRASTLC